jgi:putative cell wall-binding protein
VFRRFLSVVVLTLLVGTLLPAVAGAESAAPLAPTTSERLRGFAVQGGELQAATRSAAGMLRSAATRTSPFTMVGFELPDERPLSFRTSADGEDWSDWQVVEPMGPDDEGPDADHPDAAANGGAWRYMTQTPVWTGPAEWLQVEGGDPRQVVAHLIDTDGQSRSLLERARDRLRGTLDAVGTAPADAAMRVISRAEWGADESLRKGSPSYASNVRYAVVHHTANNNTYSADQAAAVVRGIYRYHTVSLGWSDVGYNFLIDRYGRVYEGRAGGIDRGVIGAHAQGFNTGSVGVAVIGTFTAVQPPAVAINSLVDVLSFAATTHGFNPDAKITVTSGGSNKWPKGSQVRLDTITAHRDVGNTACPGNAFYAMMPTIRQRTAAGAENWAANAARTCQPLGDPNDGPVHRAQGPNRIHTAIVASKWYWRDGQAPNAIVASARNWPDALAAAALAAQQQAPLLLTEPGALPAEVSAELRRLGTRRVWLLGGTTAVNRSVESQLASVVGQVNRISGANRYATAAQIAKQVGIPVAGEVVVALGDHPDQSRAFNGALAASALAATPQRVPTLLTKPEGIPTETRTMLGELKPRSVLVVGDTGTMSPTVKSWLEHRYHVTYLEGADRYATSLAVVEEAKRRLPLSSQLVFASGVDYPDALAGGAVAARRGAPLLLVHPCALDRVTRITNYIKANRGAYAEGGVILGGPAAVSDRVRWQLNQAFTS